MIQRYSPFSIKSYYEYSRVIGMFQSLIDLLIKYVPFVMKMLMICATTFMNAEYVDIFGMKLKNA